MFKSQVGEDFLRAGSVRFKSLPFVQTSNISRPSLEKERASRVLPSEELGVVSGRDSLSTLLGKREVPGASSDLQLREIEVGKVNDDSPLADWLKVNKRP